MKKRKLEKGELGFLLLLTALCIPAILASAKLLYSAPLLSGEGTVPLAVALVMLAMCGLMLQNNEYRGEKTGAKELFRFLFPGKTGLFLLCCLVYAVALPYLGFALSSFLFLCGTMLCLKPGKKLSPLLISALTVAVIMLLFRFIFKVQLP